ncbi:helix-turn-helix domain-containing protein [Saccharopolyspora sp. NPDC047091]|uniref:helix-turn-helix domain-containing protein n=1 Tax=Saccharopolyspora sp. NPDC047091 TaxID=3155924 RepID=UPI0033D95F06
MTIGTSGGGALGDFLRARRAALTPAAAGLGSSGGRRRVRGLRREEVAALASISTDHYTRLEQGRRTASEPVLEALARVLLLGADERAYLFELSGKDAGRPARPVRQRARPELLRLLADLTTTPAMLLGRRTDVLAWNPMAAALYTDFDRIPLRRRNFVRLVFLEPEVRSRYPRWPEVARACTAQLRMEAAAAPGDPLLAELVAELSAQDADFRRWWGAHQVAARESGSKVLRHPVAGELVLDWSALASTADPDQQLIALTAEPGTPGHDGLGRLAELAER